MTTYPPKEITFTNTYTRIPDIKLMFKDGADNILTSPVDATNITTTGFTIPSFESDLPIAGCDWTAGGVKQKYSNTVTISTRWLSNIGAAIGSADIPTRPAGTTVTVYIANAGTVNHLDFEDHNMQILEFYTGPQVAAGQPLTVTTTTDRAYDVLAVWSASSSAPTFSVTYSYFA